jgi:hypothetical protein
MHCPACQRQRPPSSRFCVVCGARLVSREVTEIEQEIARAEWLLAEAARWDVTLVSRADTARVATFYGQQVQWLRSELQVAKQTRRVAQAPAVTPMAEQVDHVTPLVEVALVTPAPQGSTAAERLPAVEQPLGAQPLAGPLDELAAPSHPAVEPLPQVMALVADVEEPSPPPARPADEVRIRRAGRSLDAAEPSVTVADPLEARATETVAERVVNEASSWSLVWKPFLTDSIGWFVGGFLILSGTFWFVADAWAGMTSTTRAGTVFGLAAMWTLAFFAWARFLLRRPTTAPAGRMLERLAAAMAPLATVAVGPAHDTPWLFWPMVLGWTVVTGALAQAPTRRVDPRSAGVVGLAFGAAALMMGVAPLVVGLGVQATWLVALPVGLAAFSSASGPREGEGANAFLLAAFGWALVLFAARLEVALVAAGLPLTLTLLAPMGAAAVASVRWLMKPAVKAADPWSVLVVVTQVAMLALSIDLFTPKPAFVVTALISAFTAYRFASQRISLASARWLPVAYVFSYLAYQRIDQLVPPVVREAFNALKRALGYETAPLPPSYGSVYAALFVVGVGVLALVWERSKDALRRHEGQVLLDTTAVASGLSSLLAVMSLSTDARPAVVATPVLAVATLLFALKTGRWWLTLAGTVGALGAGSASSRWSWRSSRCPPSPRTGRCCPSARCCCLWSGWSWAAPPPRRSPRR